DPRRARYGPPREAEGQAAVPLRQGLYRQTSGIRRPAQVTFLCAPGIASFRGARAERANPESRHGLRSWFWIPDSGLRPAPGMTGVKRRAKRGQNSLFQVHLTQSLLFDKIGRLADHDHFLCLAARPVSTRCSRNAFCEAARTKSTSAI